MANYCYVLLSTLVVSKTRYSIYRRIYCYSFKSFKIK